MKTRALSIKTLLLAAILLVMTIIPISEAFATFVSPRRVDIADRQRTASLNIVNRSDRPVSYTFGWQRRALSPDGEVLVLKEGQTTPGYRPADEIIQFSPRRITLQPGERQKIRFLVQRPADLPEGEYYSHFLIMPEPIEEGMGPRLNREGIGGVLQVRTHTALPVFVRQGKTDVSLELREASIFQKNGTPHFRYALANTSTRTIYARGEIECYTSVENKTTRPITTARVYAEARSFTREAPLPPDLDLSACGSIKFRLTGTDDADYKNKTLSVIDVQRK